MCAIREVGLPRFSRPDGPILVQSCPIRAEGVAGVRGTIDRHPNVRVDRQVNR